MPEFRKKTKGIHKGQSYPLEPGSDIKTGHIPEGKPALKRNVTEVKVKESSKPVKKGSEAVPPASDPAPNMVEQAEQVLKGADDAD